MLSINTNIASLIAQNSMKTSTDKLNQAIERMTTGLKINHASDNAANYSISTNLTTQLGAYDTAADNVAMGLDMITTASESLGQISDKLTRLRDLATQASNGTYGEQSLNAINSEVNALVDEINRLYSTAEYNGIDLFTNSAICPAPTMATFGARSTGFGYSQEEIDEMTTITEAYNTGSFVVGETYSISSVEELEKFRDMVNAGNTGAGSTFVLTENLDLSGISNWTPIGNDFDNGKFFSGVFDGNGKVISNLTINDSTGTSPAQGLFGFVSSHTIDNCVEIKNLGVENVNIDGCVYIGAIIGAVVGDSLLMSFTNNYSSGIIKGNSCVGGFIGAYAPTNSSITISNNYSTATVASLGACTGGLVGYIAGINTTTNLSNNYATGVVTGVDYYGGFIGLIDGDMPIITNAYSTQVDIYATQMTEGEILSPANLESMGFTEANGWTIINGSPVLNWQSNASGGNTGGTGGETTQPLIGSNLITFQIGVKSDAASKISLDLGFSLGAIDDLRMIGLDLTTDYLSMLDDMLTIINAKEVEYGAAQNRLDSALESIEVNINNLTSTRSTIRDADIAEVSSQYIQQQILQQAAATLMATANQSPAIALQLI